MILKITLNAFLNNKNIKKKYCKYFLFIMQLNLINLHSKKFKTQGFFFSDFCLKFQLNFNYF